MYCVLLPEVVLLDSLSFLTEKCGILIRKPLPGAWDGLVFNSVL